MSALTKKQMIKFINNELYVLRSKSQEFSLDLQCSSDFMFMKCMEICQKHAENIDLKTYEPNEGLNGRSLYKQKLITKDITEVVQEIDKVRMVIQDSMKVVFKTIENFLEQNKYYFHDDIDESDK